jgi:signal transduction histidine kinase
MVVSDCCALLRGKKIRISPAKHVTLPLSSDTPPTRRSLAGDRRSTQLNSHGVQGQPCPVTAKSRGFCVGIKNIQTAHLVHDLKNPVNIIETSARSLLEKQSIYGSLTPKQEKIIARVLRNALKIRSLANSMLEVDKAALGMLNPTECTLVGILKSALIEVFDLVEPQVSNDLEDAPDVASLARVLAQSGIYLEAEESHLSRTLWLDETKLCLVVTNLLSNAFKYKDKSVFLKCSADANTITVSVADDGPGIPACYHQQIFDQYFQCVKVEGFPVRGHGLGLAGALALTEAMGGSLVLCNTPRGAEFKIEIKMS